MSSIEPLSISPFSHYVLFFDGCSKGNPGKAGAGAVIYKRMDGGQGTDHLTEIWADSSFVGNHETNNISEYHGLLLGLEKAVSLGIKHLMVKGDSQLVIKQMTGKFAVKSPNMYPLHKRATALASNMTSISYHHVYREHNKRADELSNEGLVISYRQK